MKNLIKLCVMLFICIISIVQNSKPDDFSLLELRGGRQGSKHDSIGRDCVIAKSGKGSCVGTNSLCDATKKNLEREGRKCGEKQVFHGTLTCTVAGTSEVLRQCEGDLAEKPHDENCYQKYKCIWRRQGEELNCVSFDELPLESHHVDVRSTANCKFQR